VEKFTAAKDATVYPGRRPAIRLERPLCGAGKAKIRRQGMQFVTLDNVFGVDTRPTERQDDIQVLNEFTSRQQGGHNIVSARRDSTR